MPLLLKQWSGKEAAAIFRGKLFPASGPVMICGAFSHPLPESRWPMQPAAPGVRRWGRVRLCLRDRVGSELFPRPNINYFWITNFFQLSNAFLFWERTL